MVIYDIFITTFKWLYQSLLKGNGHVMTCIVQDRQYFIILFTEASQFRERGWGGSLTPLRVMGRRAPGVHLPCPISEEKVVFVVFVCFPGSQNQDPIKLLEKAVINAGVSTLLAKFNPNIVNSIPSCVSVTSRSP